MLRIAVRRHAEGVHEDITQKVAPAKLPPPPAGDDGRPRRPALDIIIEGNGRTNDEQNISVLHFDNCTFDQGRRLRLAGLRREKCVTYDRVKDKIVGHVQTTAGKWPALAATDLGKLVLKGEFVAITFPLGQPALGRQIL